MMGAVVPEMACGSVQVRSPPASWVLRGAGRCVTGTPGSEDSGGRVTVP